MSKREPQNTRRIPCAYRKSGMTGWLTIMALQGRHAPVAYRSRKTCRCGRVKRVPIYARKGKALGVIVRGKKVPFKKFNWRTL